MNKKTYLLLSLILISTWVQAQVTITGSLIDSNTYLPVRLATVSLIRESDSVLVAYTRTNYEGKYTLTAPSSGVYGLLYAHPIFVDYMDKIIVGTQDINLGEKSIMTRAKMLQEVIVKQKGQIFIKGDTLEYLTDSLKLDETANVEELLRALPGMQVDKDGNITAQGEKVEKVLVDGEEFFGNDPTMVTRNLNANIVDKVQVYEKKSEEAEFTGIDDGNSEKTIDIKLKKDMNQGTFGKVALNGGLEDIWDNALMINNFKNKRKITAYGIISSNGESGLSWQDMQKYGLPRSGTVFTDEGMEFGLGDDLSYTGEGLPRSWSGGFNYSNKWKDKHEFKIGAGYKKMDLRENDSSYYNNYINEDAYSNDRINSSYGVKDRYSADISYEWKIDSLTTIGLNANASLGHTNKDENNNLSNVLLSTSDIVSRNITKQEYSDTSTEFNTQAYLKRKLGKPGRTLSLYYNYNQSDNPFSQVRDQETQYSALSNHTIQKINGLTNSSTQGASLTYTEPLYKEKVILKLSEKYSRIEQNTDYDNNARDFNSTEYEFIDSLSNNFDFIQEQYLTEAVIQYQNDKIKSNIGMGVGVSGFERKDYLRPQNSQQYDRTNLFPAVNFRYSFNQFTQLRFRYTGRTSQPSLTQLQPNYDYSNPLNITYGNPDLEQSYNQNANINFWSYDAFSERSVYGGFAYGNVINSIRSVAFFDPTLGRSISTYKNMDGIHSFNQWFGWSKKFDSTNFRLGLHLNSGYNTYPFETNGVAGRSSSLRLTPSVSFNYDIESKLNASLELRPTYNNTRSDIELQNNNYWSFEPNAYITYRPIRAIKLQTDIEYLFRQKTPPFTSDFHRTLWNASISGFIDSARRMEIKLTAHDILNQNKGYDRNSYGFVVSERYFTTIQRYFMLGFIYKFARGPMAAKQNPGEEDKPNHW